MMNSRTRTAMVLISTAVALLAMAAPAMAKAVKAELRVEGRNGQALDPGTTYRTNTVTARSSSKCGPTTENRHTLRGPNAMGIVADAAGKSEALDPFRVSDTFGFGLIVCEIGRFGAFNSAQAWLFKVDHVAPSVGADQVRLKSKDEVLWYFANFNSGQNTGAELQLNAPARVGAGQKFTVRAVAFDSNGKRTPAAGVRIGGGAFPLTGPDGRATGTINSARGFANLRATRGNDIPAAPAQVCERGGKRCP